MAGAGAGGSRGERVMALEEMDGWLKRLRVLEAQAAVEDGALRQALQDAITGRIRAEAERDAAVAELKSLQAEVRLEQRGSRGWGKLGRWLKWSGDRRGRRDRRGEGRGGGEREEQKAIVEAMLREAMEIDGSGY